MSVIGIDFGNDSCYIAVARQGGIETIANDYSLRSTPACVAFGEKSRILGVAAKNQTVTNIKNTVINFKRFLGKTYRDPSLQKELKGLPFRVVEQKGGNVGIVVQYMGEERCFSPTQITAMLFTKLKHTAEIALRIKVVDVVIGVPCFFDDAGRHAMLEAAAAAGLNVLRLINETTAVALAYGIYKQDLPPIDEKPRNVIFVDCGQSNLQVSAVAFNRGKLKVLTHTANTHIGGRNFDVMMATHFNAEFKGRYNINTASNPRAWNRLLNEVEKLKKQMSANSTELPLNIECLMDDKDVTGKLRRADVEALAATSSSHGETPLIQKIALTLEQCLTDSGLKLDDIYSVEIVGGATRVPSIKQMIESVFKKTPSTTLNADEAVARGCALQCAMLSPTFKVREFSITDVQPYSIKLIWQDESGHESDMEVFPRNQPVPYSKMLTFHRKAPFTLQAHYSAPIPCPDSIIGHFTIQDITPTPEGESQKVKIKVRLNLHGLFTVASATMSEKKETVEEEVAQTPMETEDKITNGPDASQNGSKEISPDNPNGQDQKMEEKTDATETSKVEPVVEKKVKKVKTIDLSIHSVVNCLDPGHLNSIIEQEGQMVQSDKLENERINAKNAVEEYVYDMRGKINDELEKYISEDDRSSYSLLLDDTENWLYEDGEDCSKQIYVDKLAELKKLGEPIKGRKREREEVPIAFECLLASMQHARKILTSFHQGDENYNHLDAAEMEKVEKALKEGEQWADKQMGALSICPLQKDVPITANQVYSEKGTFEAVANPIINKTKPKPKVEEKTTPPPPPTEDQASQEPNPEHPAAAPATEDSMDVD